jgi:hypothetical protein
MQNKLPCLRHFGSSLYEMMKLENSTTINVDTQYQISSKSDHYYQR